MRPPYPTSLPSWLHKCSVYRRFIWFFILAFGVACGQVPLPFPFYWEPQTNPNTADTLKPFSAQDCVDPDLPPPDVSHDRFHPDNIYCEYHGENYESASLNLYYWKLTTGAQGEFDSMRAVFMKENVAYDTYVDTTTAYYKMKVFPGPVASFDAIELYKQHFTIQVTGSLPNISEADAQARVQGLISFAEKAADQHYQAPP